MNITKKEITEKDLINAIKNYAIAYEILDDLQQIPNNNLIPIGDQKTGAIGEYIGKKILEGKFNSKLDFVLNPSNKGFDIEHKSKFYQIKTISEFRNEKDNDSKKKTSRIKIEFEKGKFLNGILILLLDKSLLKGCYYFITDIDLLKERKKAANSFTISKHFLENNTEFIKKEILNYV